MSEIDERKEKRKWFLRAVYAESGGSPSRPVQDTDLSERLGISPEENWDEFSELADFHRQAGNIEVHETMYGTITITLKGVQEAEKHMNQGSRSEQRKQFLRVVYELADASTNEFVYWQEVAPRLGWDEDNREHLGQALRIADYLAESRLLRIETDEGRIYRITAAGIDAVEQEESALEPPPISIDTGTEVIEKAPPALRDSLRRFQSDYPDRSKVAFILMQFTDSIAHRGIAEAIKDTLAEHGIKGVRADEKEYHEDLYPNVQTYMHGCAFGVAVFERIESDDFNPNVSLELGYLNALEKQVCLLKDSTLRGLHTDLVGKLYRPFDFQKPGETIPPELTKWLSDWGFAGY